MGFFDPDPVQKQVYDVEYKKMKDEGYPFHPFATWKDAIVALLILLTLLGLTFIKGVHLDAPADPTSQYLPRPEWYFMWLLQLLKYFPGPTAIIAVAIIPGLLSAALVLLPFYDKNPYRHPKRRPVATAAGLAGVFAIVGLTFLAYWEDFQHAKSGAMAVTPATTPGGSAGATSAGGTTDGSGIYAANCAMCHGQAGTQIPNVALFDASFIKDVDVVDVVTNGKGGMPAFKGRLSDDEIKSVADWIKHEAK